MSTTISNNNQFNIKDFWVNAGGTAVGGAAYLAVNRGFNRATLPYLGKLTRETSAQTDKALVNKAVLEVLDSPEIVSRRISLVDVAQLPKIPRPQSKWAYIFNKAKPETINRSGYSKEILALEQQVDTILKYTIPKWKRPFKGLAEHQQKVGRYLLQEGMTAVAFPGKNYVFANIDKFGASVFHEIGHLLNPAINIKAAKLKRPLPFFIIGALLTPKLKTGENNEKKLNRCINFLRNCTPLLAFAGWLPVIATEKLASEKGIKLAKPFLDEKNTNLIQKAYKYAGSTYAMAALGTATALFAGLKAKDWIIEHRKQIAQKFRDKI